MAIPFSLFFLGLLAVLFLSPSTSHSTTFGTLTTTMSNTATAATATAPAPAASSLSPPPTVANDLPYDHSFFSHTSLLAPILSHLGFNDLATAAPSLSSDSTITPWSGPSTLFAPFDSSIHTCFSCSVPNILREHIVPGLFTIEDLRNLSFGTKVETLSPGRCITVTFSRVNKNGTARVFIGGVEITHPDLFNNGLMVIHGVQGYIATLSPFSCEVERLSSLSFHQPPEYPRLSYQQQQAVMRMMLRDAMLRLRNNGFSILSLAMKVKYADLVTLSNMTVFALDDVSIFSGSHSYISSIRFHIVPNHYLTRSDLDRLPIGYTLPTLESGQSLLITTAWTAGHGGSVGGGGVAPLRINYVRLRVPDLMRNLKIVVHSVYLPFPRIHPTVPWYEGHLDGGDHAAGTCDASVLEEDGSCGLIPLVPPAKPMVEIEDHNGL